MRVFVFPGQGSQKKGMGGELFDTVEEFKSVESQVDEVVGYSLREMCLHDSENNLDLTQYTQPCLYIVNALHFYKEVSEGKMPEAVAGHSLGEYNALLAAGSFDFLTGLKLVKKRGELMAQAEEGTMAAIVGLTVEEIEKIIRDEGFDGVEIANFNSPGQTVISGVSEQIERAILVFKNSGARLAVPLKVSGAFHSRFMKNAAKEFEEFLAPYTFETPKIPVIANVTAEPYPAEQAGAAIQDLLVKQIFSSVQWTNSIRYLVTQGENEFEEVGPGNVLTKLIRQIKS